MAEPIPSFADLYGLAPTALVDAPGRVNLIGEHTDYNGGFVLPVATPQKTRVELIRNETDSARVWSSAVGGEITTYEIGKEARSGAWIDYVAGVTWILVDEGFSLGGFDVRITSTVPLGGGLSSSASLEVALLRGLRALFALPIDEVQIAKIAQRAENEFVGAPVGIMDQMAASLATETSALFLDTRSLGYDFVALPREGELVVIDSGIKHEHAGGEYRTRRGECEQAARTLGVQLLCDAGPARLGEIEMLPEPLNRRARHVITENARVLLTVAALRACDLVAVGQLFLASHASMRDDYEVSTPEIDILVELSASEPDIFGARLTGGGFGGSVVMLARYGAGLAAADRVARAYAEKTGRTPAVLIPVSP